MVLVICTNRFVSTPGVIGVFLVIWIIRRGCTVFKGVLAFDDMGASKKIELPCVPKPKTRVFNALSLIAAEASTSKVLSGGSKAFGRDVTFFEN